MKEKCRLAAILSADEVTAWDLMSGLGQTRQLARRFLATHWAQNVG
jgi:hypothetical protein